MKKMKKTALPLKSGLCVLLALVFAASVLAVACTPKNAKTAESSAAPADGERTEAPETESPAPAIPPHKRSPEEIWPKATAAFADVELPRETDLNYFAIPDVVMDIMTEADIELYKRIVVACLAGETSVEIPTELGEYPNLWRVVDMYFAVFFADVRSYSIVEESGTISWTYLPVREHSETIDLFESKVHSWLEDVRDDDSEIMRILTVYQKMTTESAYNEAVYSFGHGANVIMDKKGVCWCFARAFNFLLCQMGIEALTVHAPWMNDIHEWVAFNDGEKWRYCDPTWDLGGHVTNFGFTTKYRLNGEDKSTDVLNILEGEDHHAVDYITVDDQFFGPLYTGRADGDRFVLDHENELIVFYDRGNKKVSSFNLKTGEVVYFKDN